jgi:hypothetical protein
MPAEIPEREFFCLPMTIEALGIPRIWIGFSSEDDDGNASASALFNMLGTGTVTGFAPFPIRGIPGHCFFTMNR